MPAIAASFTDHVWMLAEIVALLDLDENQGASNSDTTGNRGRLTAIGATDTIV